MGSVIYREFQNVGRLALGLGIVGIALLALSAIVGRPASGWLTVAAIFILFPVLFLASVYRMNRIRLTTKRLVVGSEVFEPSDFDFTFGIQPSLVLYPGEQAEIESRWKLSGDEGLRIAGGSWGRRIGTAMIVLRESNGRGVVAVFTRRPDVLGARLTEWLETVPE